MDWPIIGPEANYSAVRAVSKTGMTVQVARGPRSRGTSDAPARLAVWDGWAGSAPSRCVVADARRGRTRVLEVLEAVDGSALYRWADACVTGIEKRCDEINDLMSSPSRTRTPERICSQRCAQRSGPPPPLSADERGADASAVARALARGAVTGARGKLGCDSLPGAAGGRRVHEVAQARRRHLPFGAAARIGSGSRGCQRPDGGNHRHGARGRRRRGGRGDAGAPLARLSAVAADAAAEALLRTPSQLAVLGAAGVVDGRWPGLVVILDALVEVICGVPPAREAFLAPAARVRRPARSTCAAPRTSSTRSPARTTR